MFMTNIIVLAHNAVDKHQESVCFSNKNAIILLRYLNNGVPLHCQKEKSKDCLG